MDKTNPFSPPVARAGLDADLMDDLFALEAVPLPHASVGKEDPSMLTVVDGPDKFESHPVGEYDSIERDPDQCYL
jgi:hypothetical protein